MKTAEPCVAKEGELVLFKGSGQREDGAWLQDVILSRRINEVNYYFANFFFDYRTYGLVFCASRAVN